MQHGGVSWVAAAAAVVAVGSAACRENSRPRHAEEAKALARCAEAIRDWPAEAMSAFELARACPTLCPGYADSPRAMRLATMVDRCEFLCTGANRASIAQLDPRRRMHELYEQCGERHYRLPTAARSLLSPDYFLTVRLAEMLSALRENREGDVLGMEVFERELLVSLPLPADSSLYHAPAARAYREPPASPYIIIGSAELRIGGLPGVVIRDDKPILHAIAGEVFPGKVVALDDLSTAAAGLGVASSEGASASPGGVERAAGETRPAASRPAIFLADRALPASRLTEVLSELGGASAVLGVFADRHELAVHRVALSHPTGAESLDLSIAVDARGALVKRLGQPPIHLPRVDGRLALAALADALRAPHGKVSLGLGEGVTVAEVAKILDVLFYSEILSTSLGPLASASGEGASALPRETPVSGP